MVASLSLSLFFPKQTETFSFSRAESAKWLIFHRTHRQHKHENDDHDVPCTNNDPNKH